MSESKTAAQELLERAKAWAPALRERQAEIENFRRIPDDIIARLKDEGFYRAMMPRSRGGFEISLDDFVRIGVELGAGCASTGWVYCTGAQHLWQIGMFDPAAQDEVWNDNPAPLAGSSYAPGGLAVEVAGGYRLSGRWMFCSGIDSCDWMLLGARVLPAPDAEPTDQGFALVPAADYAIEDNWHVVGLEGTGSKNAVMDDVFVPRHRLLRMEEATMGRPPGIAVNEGMLFRIPFFAAISICLCAPALGAAMGALAEFRETISVRATRGPATSGGKPMAEFQAIQLRTGDAAARLDSALLLVLRDCSEIMETIGAGEELSQLQRARNKGDLSHAVRAAAGAIDLLFESVGGQGLFDDNKIQRAWRDVHAATKHISLVWDSTGAIYGRTLLGLPAGTIQI